jgi:hypothetical protein
MNGLRDLGIPCEIAIGLYNNSVYTMERAFRNANANGEALVLFGGTYGVKGFCLDWEPQNALSTSGKASVSLTTLAPDDPPSLLLNRTGDLPPGLNVTKLAEEYAAMNTVFRRKLRPVGIRLTICVADWSPILNQYDLLESSVDRLLQVKGVACPCILSP